MNPRALCLVLAAMSLAGCANFSGLDTQGRRLDANTLQAGKSLSGAALSNAAWPRADWWKSLGDPQLDGLIQEALQNSPDMQVASARAHQAQAAAYAANAARMPTLDASAGVSRSRLARDQDPRGEGDAYSTVRNIGASFNYTFDLWGGQRAAWEAALGQARAAEVDQQAARLTLAADVAKAYSDLGQAHIVRDLATDDLKRTRQMLELSKRRLSAGIDSQYQYQQTESLEASSQSQLIDAEKQLQSAKIALAVLLGKGPDRGNELARPSVLKPAAVAVPSVLPAELLGRRPDLIAARWRVEAASKDIAASKTRFYPNLNLSASAGAESLLGDAMFGSPSRFFNIAPTISCRSSTAAACAPTLTRVTPTTTWRWRNTTKPWCRPWAISATRCRNCAKPAGRSRPSNTPPTLPSSPTTPWFSATAPGSVTTWMCSASSSNCCRPSVSWRP